MCSLTLLEKRPRAAQRVFRRMSVMMEWISPFIQPTTLTLSMAAALPAFSPNDNHHTGEATESTDNFVLQILSTILTEGGVAQIHRSDVSLALFLPVIALGQRFIQDGSEACESCESCSCCGGGGRGA